MRRIKVGELASARSGDKGNHANVGVVANDRDSYELLLQLLTSERVQTEFHSLGVSRVERFEIPNILAMNFLLYDALSGGASESLRIDTQGKLIGPAVMEIELEID